MWPQPPNPRELAHSLLPSIRDTHCIGGFHTDTSFSFVFFFGFFVDNFTLQRSDIYSQLNAGVHYSDVEVFVIIYYVPLQPMVLVLHNSFRSVSYRSYI